MTGKRLCIGLLLAGCASVTLSACGGGGSGGVNSSGSLAAPAPTPTPAPTPAPSPTTTPANPTYSAPVAPPAGYVVTPSDQQPTRSVNDTAEYRRNYTASELVNALYALDHGHTGAGVTVGIIDDGVNTGLGAFQGQINTALSRDFGSVTSEGTTTRRNSLGDAASDHGTAVAGIIAARSDDGGTQGLAPDAQLAVLRIDDWNADTGVETLNHAVAAIDYAGSARIKILNVSLTNGGNATWGSAVTRYGNTGGLVVTAAGNASESSPSDTGAVTAANRDTFLFVVALSPDLHDYTLASYSNRAGTMMDRTVAAVGTSVTTLSDGSTGTFSGTSAATPQVTALGALILSKWPQLSGQQAGSVILNTARDIGAPGTDEVFGRGLIDTEAALSPINPTLSNGTTTSSVASSVMAVPEAVGIESLQTALSNVTVLDEYGRDYSGSVAGLVVRPEAGQDRWLRRRLAQLSDGGQADLAAGPFSGSLGFASYRTGPGAGDVRGTLTTGSFGYRSGETAVRVGFNAQDSLQSDIMGLAPFADGILAYAPQADTSFGVDRGVGAGRIGLTLASGGDHGSSANAATLGWATGRTEVRVALIDEDGSVLGTPSAGALTLGRGATTAMIEAHRSLALAGGWTLEGYGSVGYTRLKIDSASLVTGATPLLGTRIGVQASGAAFGGLLSFGIAQPLTIEQGVARLTLGSGYDLSSRALRYGTTQASLASGTRRVQLTAGFTRGTPNGSVRLGVMQDVSDGSTKALAGWRIAFAPNR